MQIYKGIMGTLYVYNFFGRVQVFLEYCLNMLAISYIYRKNKGDGFEMKKRIISYRLKVDSILSNPGSIPPERWTEILQEHLVQIGFFQHERLIHLIVTVTFAILTLMSFVASLVVGMPALLALTLLFVVLLIPYIMHYYTLENEVQKMYVQYDRILEQIHK